MVTDKKEQKINEEIKMKGKYIYAVGKRKTATAKVRIYKTGSGNIIVNGFKIVEYFGLSLSTIVTQPLKLTGIGKDIDISIVVNGGGKNGQADAAKLGIARALSIMNSELKPILRAKGFLTRDSREKERKKPGLKRARRAPQWSKR